MRKFSTHGSGEFDRGAFRVLGENVIFENSALVFHPEGISIGSNVYIGHQAILTGYHNAEMIIGDDVWIGQQVFFHSAGGLVIGNRVGIGPGVRIVTSSHREQRWRTPILEGALDFATVEIGDECDIGVGAIILPGVTIGRGSQIGAGALVTGDLPEYCIAVGTPARVVRIRPEVAS